MGTKTLRPCVAAKCTNSGWRFRYCYSHARLLFKQGRLEGTARGVPKPCTQEGCGDLVLQRGLCQPHFQAMLRDKVHTTGGPLCGWCKQRQPVRRGVCDTCLPKKMRRYWLERSEIEKQRRSSDYDWVAVHRFWHGHDVGRKLKLAERIEVTRLLLRSPLPPSWHAIRMGMDSRRLIDLEVRYGARARAIGLDLPLRFCFLPEESLPPDEVLAS